MPPGAVNDWVSGERLSKMWLTMGWMAPTGVSATCFSPIFFSAVGEAIQFAVESMNDEMIGANTVFRLMTTVLVPCAVTEATGQVGLQVHGDLRSRWMFHTTAWALN